MRNFLLALVLLFGLPSAQAQNSMFSASYEMQSAPGAYFTPRALTNCANGDYLICSNEAAYSYAIINRIDQSGTILWSKSIGDLNLNSSHQIYSVGENSDGTFWVFGVYQDPNYQVRYFLSQFSATGTLIWDKYYFVTDEYAYASPQCKKLSTGEFMIILSVSSHMQMLKTNANGDLLWGKTYVLDEDEPKHPGFAGTETGDGGYVLTGKRGSDICVINIDASGTTRWSMTFTDQYNQPRSITALQDGNFVIAGWYDVNGYVAKISSTGSLMWMKTYINSSSNTPVPPFAEVKEYPNGDLFVSSMEMGGNCIMRLFPNGEPLFFSQPLDISEMYTYGIAKMTDDQGTAILTTNTQSMNSFKITKLDAFFNASCGYQSGMITSTTVNIPLVNQTTPVTEGNDGVQSTGVMIVSPITLIKSDPCQALSITETTTESISVYPNPVQSGTNITFMANNESWTLLDMQGRMVKNGTASNGITAIETENIAKGMYILQLANESGVLRKTRIVVE
jgi:hypothetical protein